MTEGRVHLVVLTKLPVAGRVKTRLMPALSANHAAQLHQIFLKHTAARLGAMGSLVICYDPPDAEAEIRQLVPHAVSYLAQCPGDLGARIANVLNALAPNPVLLLGIDSPDVPDQLLRAALQFLDDKELVIGPCDDGGYWCIGANGRVDVTALLSDIEWSSGRELAQTLARARSLGYSVGQTDSWSDVDRPEDLRRLVTRLRKSDNTGDMQLLKQLSALLPPAPDGVF